MKALVLTLTIMVVIGLSLAGCSYVPESQLDECRATLAEQQQTIEAQRKQIEALTQAVSENESRLLVLDNEHERIAEELRGFEESQEQSAIPVRAHIRIEFAPSTPKCDGNSIAWTMILSETHGVGVTFTKLVDWYRTFLGPFGTGRSSASYRNGVTDLEWLPIRVEPNSVTFLDLGEQECFSEERHYYYVLFGVDDNGNEIVSSNKLEVDLWEPSEQ